MYRNLLNGGIEMVKFAVSVILGIVLLLSLSWYYVKIEDKIFKRK